MTERRTNTFDVISWHMTPPGLTIVNDGPVNENGLSVYRPFVGQTTPAVEATSAELMDELVAIVEAEGPVLGERLHQAHVRASGGQRVGRQIAHALNSALLRAKNQGLLIEDDPLSESGVKPKTFRLPSQPQYIVRTLGPRILEQVPPLELAEVLAAVGGQRGWLDEELVFRGVLERYGIRRFTPNAASHLRRIRTLVDNDQAGAHAAPGHLNRAPQSAGISPVRKASAPGRLRCLSP